MNKLLEIKNVTKYYGSGDAVAKALGGVSFSMEQGEFTAIMGASGSGKSTLLNVIATIDRPSSGSIFMEGTDIAKRNEQELAAFRRDRLGFIFQEYNLLDTLTIGENIVLPLNLQKRSVRETESRLQKIAAVLEITDQLAKFPRQLSGGQRQRAACARALCGGVKSATLEGSALNRVTADEYYREFFIPGSCNVGGIAGCLALSPCEIETF